MKILIAEDEPISRRLLEANLIKWGHEVMACQHGAEAWDTMSSTLNHGLAEGWNRVTHYGARSERLLLDAFRAIEDTTHQLIPDRDRSVEGESNG